MTKLSRNAIRKIINENLKTIIDEDWVGQKDMHTPPLGSRRNDSEFNTRINTSYIDDEENTCPMCGEIHKSPSMCDYEVMEDVYLSEGGCGCQPAKLKSDMGDFSLDNMGMKNHDSPISIHVAPEGLDTMDPHEAYGIGYQKNSEKSSYMARPQLAKIAKYAALLHDMIEKGEQLKDWQESHIAQMADDVSEVYHSLEYKKHMG